MSLHVLIIKVHHFQLYLIQVYQITTVPRYYFGPVDIEKIEIQIVDEYNRTVDLNGSDISLTLTLTCVYS